MTSPGVSPTRMFDMADNIRRSLGEAALSLGLTLPTEQYITTGQADHDCPQVAFIVTAVRTGQPPSGNVSVGVPGGAAGMGCDPTWSMLLGIEIVRDCAPVPNRGGVVVKSKFEDAAFTASRDVDLLMALPPYVAAYQIVNFDCSIALPPITGGFQVVKAQLTVVI